MSNPFDAATVQANGGVAWAKQQMDVIKYTPSAIDDQITGYTNVNNSLNQIISTLNGANSSLQSAWSGSAATTATQSFTEVSNHAQNVTTVVEQTITQLKSAKATAQAAVAAMAKVPNEKPVPSGNFITNTWDEVWSGTTPAQQAEQFNQNARAQAADVLNTFSSGYNNAANNMSSLASSSTDMTGFNPSGGSGDGAISLGGGSYGGVGNPGTAYQGGTSSYKGGANDYDPHTSLQSGGTLTTDPKAGGGNPGTGGGKDPGGPGVITDPNPGGVTDPDPEPPGGTTDPGGELGPGGELPGDGPGGVGGDFGDGSGIGGGASNVFGEDGFGSGGTAGVGGVPSGIDGAPDGAAPGVISDAVGADGAAGRSVPGMGQGLGGMRGGAGGFEDEQLGPVRYSRGRFLGGDEPGAGLGEWVMPSVGGDESLLIARNAPASTTPRPTSAYEGATDPEGRPLGNMGYGGRLGTVDDEEEERGERPGYLKEDPEWWQSKQAVAPPTVK